MAGAGVPPAEKGIADRLKLLIGTQSILAFAQKCNVRYESIRQYLNGSMPGADKLAQIAEANNVSLDWLATGREAPVPGRSAGLGTSPKLMGYCLEALAQLYDEFCIKVQMFDLGQEAAALHDAILAAGVAEDEYWGALRYAVSLRRKQLHAERASPPQVMV